MQFTHTDERQMIGDTLAKFVANETSIAQRQQHAEQSGFDPETWNQLAQLGVLSALFDPVSGGFGGTGFDIMVVAGELGKGAVTTPLIESTILAGIMLAHAGDIQAKAVDAIMDGSTLPILAHLEAQGGLVPQDIETVAVLSGDTWTLNGSKSVVKFADSASALLVTAKVHNDNQSQSNVGLFAIQPNANGLHIAPYATIDGSQAADLMMTDVTGTLVLTNAEPALCYAQQAAMVAVAAEALGLMETIVAMTQDYMATRKQFGLALTKFQALQHRFTEVMMSLEAARSATIMAANALQAAKPDTKTDTNNDVGDTCQAARTIHAASYTVCQSITHVAEECVQMHGGMGVTWEYPLNHFTKRLMALEAEWGDEDHHLGQFMALASARAQETA